MVCIRGATHSLSIHRVMPARTSPISEAETKKNRPKRLTNSQHELGFRFPCHRLTPVSFNGPKPSTAIIPTHRSRSHRISLPAGRAVVLHKEQLFCLDERAWTASPCIYVSTAASDSHCMRHVGSLDLSIQPGNSHPLTRDSQPHSHTHTPYSSTYLLTNFLIFSAVAETPPSPSAPMKFPLSIPYSVDWR